MIENENDIEKIKADLILKPLNSKEELRDWMYLFLGIKFPMGVVYPTSTHGPVEAMWRIYELIKTGESEHIPQVCMLASRDSFKTLGAAALQVLCMVHFKFSVAHMAAISSQSDKAIQYINAFFRKLTPYLDANGWRQSSDNKKMVSWITDSGQEVYIRIVIATIAGANCVVGNTSIRTNKKSMRAEQIYKKVKSGEEILLLSYNHDSGDTEYKKIKNAWKTSQTKTYRIRTTKGTISCSGDHKIYVKGRGYIRAADLEKGMTVLRKKGDRDYANHGKRLSIESVRDCVQKYTTDVELKSDMYQNNSTPLIFECKKHGEFSKKWVKCLRNMKDKAYLCQKCNIERNIKKNKLTEKDIKDDIAANGFEFMDMQEYTRAQKTKVKVRCKDNHVFWISVNNFRTNARCTKCACVASSIQHEMLDYIKSIYDGEILFNTKHIISPMELDIYIPEHKLGVELDGLYWHSTKVRENAKQKNIDKKSLCNDKGISLLAIYEDEWRDKRDLVKAMIRHRLGIMPETKLRASKLEIKKLDKNKQYADFFNKFHIDGHVNSSFAYGLFYNGEMVSCASFRKNPLDKCWEIARFASNYDYHIYGALGRILKLYRKENNGKLISFSNNRLSNGNIYKALNFKDDTVTETPSYWYTDFKTRIFRTKCKRINDPDILSKYPTEKEQALGGVFSRKYFGHNLPLYRVYDYGHRKWTLE